VGMEGSVLSLYILSNDYKSTKLHYWGKGLKITNTGRVHDFRLPLIVFFVEIFLKPHIKKPTVNPLIAALIRVLKVFFFYSEIQNKFPGKNKNMEWPRENLATSGIMKSFDPIK
jgi:hypothetical protein